MHGFSHRHSEDETQPGGTNYQCNIQSKFYKNIIDTTRFVELKRAKWALLLSQYNMKFVPQKIEGTSYSRLFG